MMDDGEERSESEEEILIYAEFNESVDVDQYRSIHILGIDGKNPIIQADDSFFTGRFVSSLGTYMFFEDDPSPQTADPLFDKLPEKSLKYLCKTNKLLNMDHAYVMPQASSTDQVIKSEVEEPSDTNIKTVKFMSLNDALKNFKETLAPLVINPVEPEKLQNAELIIPDAILPDEMMET